MSFSKRIFVGLAAGAACGIILGEHVAPLKIVADGFVKLLQMTVLPYVVLSILASLGSLSYSDARRLGLRAGAVIAALWGLALVFSFILPLAFPPVSSGSFFSTTLVESRPKFNFIDLYIPSNPFYSLTYNVVPAVVLFAVVLGIALIGVPRKQQLLDVLSVFTETVARATRFVVSLTPYGIFAIAANAAGTLSLEQAGRIQIYLLSYVSIALLLSFWILPGLVSALTTVTYRDVLGSNRDALLTAFIAGDLFIVLPALIENCEQILARHRVTVHQEHKLPEVIVPVSFNFPHTGKLLSLSFILFASWFSDAALAVSDYPQLAVAGLLTMFGSINSAVPFLLDLFRIPADTFQLFIATGVINSRFGTLLATVHTIVVALLGSAAIAGTLRFQPRRLIRYAIITVLLTATTIGGLRVLFSTVLKPKFEGSEAVYTMRPLYPHPPAMVLAGDAASRTPQPESGSVASAIAARGVLRVGFFPNRIPFAFFDRQGNLVGLDVERAHMLAGDLGVRAEFIQLQTQELASAMASGRCDIIMTGVLATPRRSLGTLFSNTYMDETLAFMVQDYRRNEFTSWASVREAGRIRIGVPDLPHYVSLLRERLPSATIVTLEADKVNLDAMAGVDAFVLPAERASVLTLLNPSFTVVVPEPDTIRMPLAYPLAREDHKWADAVNRWIEMKQKDGTSDALYKHWILGRTEGKHYKRWSVMKDVLKWEE